MCQGNLTHFPICKSVNHTVTILFMTKVYANKLNTLKVEFSRRFADFETQKFNLDLFTNPFAIDVDAVPSAHGTYLTYTCNTYLKTQ